MSNSAIASGIMIGLMIVFIVGLFASRRLRESGIYIGWCGLAFELSGAHFIFDTTATGFGVFLVFLGIICTAIICLKIWEEIA